MLEWEAEPSADAEQPADIAVGGLALAGDHVGSDRMDFVSIGQDVVESRIDVEAHASDGIMEGHAAIQGKEEGGAVLRVALGLDLGICRYFQSALGRRHVAGRKAQMEFSSSVQAQQEVEKTVLEIYQKCDSESEFKSAFDTIFY